MHVAEFHSALVLARSKSTCGSVLGPILRLFCVSGRPDVLSVHVLLFAYDVKLMSVLFRYGESCQNLNAAFQMLNNFEICQ